MTSQNLTNYNESLKDAQRRVPLPPTVGNVANALRDKVLYNSPHGADLAGEGEDAPMPPSVFKKNRGYSFTPLDDFEVDHLPPSQRAILETAIQKTRAFLNEYPQNPGLSAIYAGPVGVGKTSLADNIARAFTLSYNVEGLDKRIEITKGRIIEASEMMAILGGDYIEGGARIEGAVNLSRSFDRDVLLVVDDFGTEEIKYTNEKTLIEKRQKRYGRLMDWAYTLLERKNKRVHIVLTTMIPLYVSHPSPVDAKPTTIYNPEIVNVMGRKAWTRFYQMSRGYHVDMTGLADYRPRKVSKED